MSLKTLHSFGYSHGDLKPENICARINKQGNYKYTLIDFGMCQKLPIWGELPKINENFRGNYMFCSEAQLNRFSPTEYCDLLALVVIAYEFIFMNIPYT